jgi:capsule polysaccharide export protein KpsE/RkpR
MPNEKLTRPTVHSNGTSRSALAESLRAAHAATSAAEEAVRAAAPHLRDYYPQGGGAFDRAQAEHRSRLSRLSSVLEELSALHLAVHDG